MMTTRSGPLTWCAIPKFVEHIWIVSGNVRHHDGSPANLVQYLRTAMRKHEK